MSEAVGVCIVSCGELYAAADTARFELCLKVIGAKLDTNSLNNGCDFPTSSQVSQKVLLPFFKKKYSVHLLIGIFHGDNDGLWMLGGNTQLGYPDIARVWEAAKFGACSHLTIVVDSCYSGWWAKHAAEYAAENGCPGISVQTACGTGGDLCKTPDDRRGYTFTSFWADKQKEKRGKLNDPDFARDEKLIKTRGPLFWHGSNAKRKWAYVGDEWPAQERDQKANTTATDPTNCHEMITGEVPTTKTRPFLEKLLGEDLEEKDMVACLKSFVEHHTANLGKQRHFLIVCDGNISCGKTTFLDEIGNSQHVPSDVQIFREPVAKNVAHSWWSLLEKFYKDMKNGKGPAAVIALENAIWAHHRKIATQRESHVITERCCDSSVGVFLQNALQKKGTLPEGEFKKFMADLSQMNADVAHKPTLVLYFRLSVEEAMRRIKKRAEEEGREFEKEITEEYLQELDCMYEELYKDREDVIRLDSNMPPDEIKREVAEALQNNAAKYHRVLEDKGLSQEDAEELLMHMTSCFRLETP